VLRVGFVGLGFISDEHVLGYIDNEDARIVAVADVDAEKGRAWLRKWKLPYDVELYTNFEDMLQREALDILEILTPHNLHCPMVLKAAEASVKNISVQKPMGLNLREANRMIQACRAKGVKLRVYENALFYPIYRKAKELIDGGLIGELLTMRSCTMVGIRGGIEWPSAWSASSWRGNLATAGSGPLIGDHGFHRFSVVRWFMERDFEKVDCWIEPDTRLDAPAFIRAKLRTAPDESPKYAQIDFTFSPRMSIPSDFWLDDFVEVVGDKGIMWINQCDAAGDREMYKELKMSSSPVFPPIAVFIDGRVDTYLADISLGDRNWSTSFVASTRHFIKAIIESEEPIYTGEDAMEIKRYIVASYLSAQERREISIDQITLEAEERGELQLMTNFCNQ
jgi:predicted dehydrogenase